MTRLYFAIRDPDWNTLAIRFEPPLVTTSSSGFDVTRTGSCESLVAPIDFTLNFASLTDSLTSQVRYRARTDLAVNRVGFCLLHPMSFAGSPLLMVREGTPHKIRFPARIAPWTLVSDFSELEFAVGQYQVKIEFSGDTFDLEDQRNWIDASFKTFAPRLPNRYLGCWPQEKLANRTSAYAGPRGGDRIATSRGRSSHRPCDRYALDWVRLAHRTCSRPWEPT